MYHKTVYKNKKSKEDQMWKNNGNSAQFQEILPTVSVRIL